MGCLSTGDSASLIRFEGHRSGSFVTASESSPRLETAIGLYCRRKLLAGHLRSIR